MAHRPGGSTDRVVVEFALRTNQVIVTKNHDMMTICAELGQRFVWLDPLGKGLSREHQVVLVFQQVRDWERCLAANVRRGTPDRVEPNRKCRGLQTCLQSNSRVGTT